jgi:hypothetical protein
MKLNAIGDTYVSKNVTLKVGQSIDYKSATEPRISMGKIAAFKYAGHQQENKESVWMRVVDVEENTKSEWISLNVWEDQNKKGYFKKLTAKPVTNASTEPEDDDDLPF